LDFNEKIVFQLVSAVRFPADGVQIWSVVGFASVRWSLVCRSDFSSPQKDSLLSFFDSCATVFRYEVHAFGFFAVGLSSFPLVISVQRESDLLPVHV
jgi:hypothetical protein